MEWNQGDCKGFRTKQQNIFTHLIQDKILYFYICCCKLTLVSFCPLTATLASLSLGQFVDKFIDIDAYIKYNDLIDTSTNQLRGAESVLEFQFRYCNDYGMLLYQDGGSSPEQQTLFFALGVSARKLYLEWKVTTDSLVEVGSK